MAQTPQTLDSQQIRQSGGEITHFLEHDNAKQIVGVLDTQIISLKTTQRLEEKSAKARYGTQKHSTLTQHFHPVLEKSHTPLLNNNSTQSRYMLNKQQTLIKASKTHAENHEDQHTSQGSAEVRWERAEETVR